MNGYFFGKYLDGDWFLMTEIPRETQNTDWKVAPGWIPDTELPEKWAIHLDELENGAPDEIDWDGDPLVGAWEAA